MHRQFGRMYWYIIASVNGKVAVWHKSEWTSEEQANMAGFKALPGRIFITQGRPWHDVARMTQEAKSMHLEEKSDLPGAIKRATHVMPPDERHNIPVNASPGVSGNTSDNDNEI